MLKIKQIPVGQMQANCYIVWDETNQAVIIDPGDDADLIIQTILDNDLTPKAIFATHGHIDHVMAALEIKLAFNIPFYIHKDDQFLLDRMRETAKHFLEIDPGPACPVDFYFEDKIEIKIGTSTYKINETPGHTPGSVCIYEKKSKTVFVGDLVFANGSLGRTDFEYSDKQLLKKSLRAILKLPGDTKVLSGHGEGATLRQLRETHFQQKL